MRSTAVPALISDKFMIDFLGMADLRFVLFTAECAEMFLTFASAGMMI